MQSILYSSTFSPLSLPNFGTLFFSLETVSITPLRPLRVNNNRFPFPTHSLVCHWFFFCSLSILYVYFFQRWGGFFSITMLLEAYLKVIAVAVLRSRCWRADTVQVEECCAVFCLPSDKRFRERRGWESYSIHNLFLFYIPQTCTSEMEEPRVSKLCLRAHWLKCYFLFFSHWTSVGFSLRNFRDICC